jgi:hypothetical protein
VVVVITHATFAGDAEKSPGEIAPGPVLGIIIEVNTGEGALAASATPQ